jgi:hypothetical protein
MTRAPLLLHASAVLIHSVGRIPATPANLEISAIAAPPQRGQFRIAVMGESDVPRYRDRSTGKIYTEAEMEHTGLAATVQGWHSSAADGASGAVTYLARLVKVPGQRLP